MHTSHRTFYLAALLLAGVMNIAKFAAHAAPPPDTTASSPLDYTVVTADDRTERRPGDPPEVDVVTLTNDPAKRAPLEHVGDASDGEYHFSPDARWLYADYHVGSGLRSGELFAHREGPRFIALDKKKRFSELAWDFCAKQGVTPKVEFDAADAQLIDFVAWSPDSARLLVEVRGGEKHGEGIYEWAVYWNTRTRAFELTDYLRSINRGAARRWKDDDFRGDSASAACAEPLPGGWPALGGLKKQYDDADHRLNTVYATKIAKLASKDKQTVRDAQRQWLKRRDAGALGYVSFGADPAEREIRRLQYLAGATLQRVHELEPDSDTE